MKVWVDPEMCGGHALCLTHAPEARPGVRDADDGLFTRIPDFQVQWNGVERFEDCGSVYAVRHLPVTFAPGLRRKPAA